MLLREEDDNQSLGPKVHTQDISINTSAIMLRGRDLLFTDTKFLPILRELALNTINNPKYHIHFSKYRTTLIILLTQL